MSKTGFTVEEIEANCDLFINGHLHNGQFISSKIVNLGNLTGKDFGEDAFKHSHNVAILDTKTLELTFIENPHAFNFYKVQIENINDLNVLDTLKNNAVVSIKCDAALLDATKSKISANTNIIDSRLIITKAFEDVSESHSAVELSVDHMARFIECCRANIEDTALLNEEINEICK
jgi:hypothetical protein